MNDWSPPSYLKTLRPLLPGDQEYRMMEYALKLALRSTTARVISVHALHTPEENIRFEREHVGSVVLDSWVYTPALPDDNTVAQIASHGGRFRITDPTKGALFPSGAIRLHADEHGDDYSQRHRPAGVMQLEFLHLRLCTGQSFVMERDQIGRYPVPEGYHSIKIHREDEGEDPSSFYHEYILNDASRVWPDFVVNCIYDPEEDRKGLVGMQNRMASWRGQCYQDAFVGMMEELERQRKLIEDRKRTIISQLQLIDEKMDAVTQNHAHAQDKIYHTVQQVVQMLTNRTQSKLNLLQSDDAELHRQLRYFDWVESFLNYQRSLMERNLLDPVEFLQNAAQHKLLLDDVPSEIVDAYTMVHADMKVVGNLTILVDEATRPIATTPTANAYQPPAPYPTSLPQHRPVQPASRPWTPVNRYHSPS